MFYSNGHRYIKSDSYVKLSPYIYEATNIKDLATNLKSHIYFKCVNHIYPSLKLIFFIYRLVS